MTSCLLPHADEAWLRHQLRGFPSHAVAAFLHLKAEADEDRLYHAVLAVLTFYLPRGHTIRLEEHSPEARLREDLGIDSLAFAEAAYKLEELFAVRVENAELAAVKTLGDLRTFAVERLLEGTACTAEISHP